MKDTFSANSIKILDKSYDEFKLRYVDKLNLLEFSKDTFKGNKLHSIICYYLKGYDISKFKNALSDDELLIFNNLKNSKIVDFIKSSDEKFIEKSFYIKEEFNTKPFYLTGRFDIVVKNSNKYTIIDWKTGSIPKEPYNDIQTIVYFEAAEKLFNTKSIEMIYYSLEKESSTVVHYEGFYSDKIKKIISKAIR